MQLSPNWSTVISGQNNTPSAKVLRLLLGALACPYALIVRTRNWLYDHGYLASFKLPVPVICVGNITIGGTGKTPLAIWLCSYLLDRQYRVALLSRSYKGLSPTGNEEIRLIRQSLPSLAIVIDGDRVRAGRKAIADCQADVIVLDDGFQHRRLQRDLDIVAVDCTCPFGYETLLPRGLLREPVNQLTRADIIVLTRSDQIPKESLARLTQRVQELLQARPNHRPRTDRPIALSQHVPVALVAASGTTVELTQLQNKRALAFCGIGNPNSFVTTLQQLGTQVVAQRFFDDHHCYTPPDCEALGTLRRRQKADWLVTTEKDWVKLSQLPAARAIKELYWLKIKAVFTTGQEQLCALVDQTMSKTSDKPPPL